MKIKTLLILSLSVTNSAARNYQKYVNLHFKHIQLYKAYKKSVKSFPGSIINYDFNSKEISIFDEQLIK